MPKKSGRKKADTPIQFKPFKDQLSEIDRLGGSWGKDRPTVVLELLDEALKARRLKAIGKDEATAAVVAAQKGAMTEVLAPALAQLERLTGAVERMNARMIDEFDHSTGILKFLVLAIKFIVVEVMVTRVLQRDYVHTVYKLFVENVGRPTAELETNFNRRVVKYREEAEGVLSNLSDASVGELREMIETPTALREPEEEEAAGGGRTSSKGRK